MGPEEKYAASLARWLSLFIFELTLLAFLTAHFLIDLTRGNYDMLGRLGLGLEFLILSAAFSIAVGLATLNLIHTAIKMAKCMPSEVEPATQEVSSKP
jgi:hypothetical protein